MVVVPPAPDTPAAGAVADLLGLFESWLDMKQSRSRGLAPNSERAYRHDLALVCGQIADAAGRPPARADPDSGGLAVADAEIRRCVPSDLTEARIERVMSALRRDGRAPASRKRALTTLRGFCGWLAETGILTVNPAQRFETPRQADLLPVYLTTVNLRAVLQAAATDVPDAGRPRAGRRSAAWPERDVALVAVLAGAGVRASELTGMRVGDLRRDEMFRVEVVGKGRKGRSIPVDGTVVDSIDRYISARAGAGAGGQDANDVMFVRRDGSGLTTAALDRLVEGWLRRAGVALPPGERAHLFRHTYAVHQLLNGLPIPELQALLGHASLQTTAIYLRVTPSGTSGATAPIAPLLRELRMSGPVDGTVNPTVNGP